MADINLMIKTGVTFTKTFVWQQADGSRRSLAGMAAKMQIRKKVGAPVLVEVDSASGHILLESVEVEGSAVGTFTVVIPGPLTAGVKEPAGVYDIKFTTADTEDGEPSYRPSEGEVAFDLAVTK